MKKLLLALIFTLTTAAAASAANYIQPKDLKVLLDQKQPVLLLDIQVPAEFAAHHLRGSLETNAFPAKSAEEKKRLDAAIPAIKASTAPVVVVCPRGKGGAKNSYEHLVAQGIPESRLLILEGGMLGWPYQELAVQGR